MLIGDSTSTDGLRLDVWYLLNTCISSVVRSSSGSRHRFVPCRLGVPEATYLGRCSRLNWDNIDIRGIRNLLKMPSF